MKSALILLLLFSLNCFGDEDGTSGVIKPEPQARTDGGPSDLMETGRKRAALPSLQDDQRAENVLVSLAKEAGWFPNVTITVKKGIVTIKGSAKNAEQLHWLATTADRIPSVIAVLNQATIDQAPVSDFTPAVKETRRLIESAKKKLPLVTVAVLLTALFLFFGRYIRIGMNRVWSGHISNPFLLSTVTRLSMLPFWLIFFYLVLQVAGLSSFATTIIGGTGVLGIVIGFAFKDIAENYISGLILSIRSPFTKGDEVGIDKYEGYVQSLSMRGTTIFDYDGTMILIPNRIVLQSIIKNMTVNPKTRVVLNLGIGVEDPASEARELVVKVLGENTAVLKDPAPNVTATEIGKTSVNLRVAFWFDGATIGKFKILGMVVETIQQELLQEGFTLMTEIRAMREQRQVRANATAGPRRQPGETSGNERDAFRINENVTPLKPDADRELFQG